MNHSVRKISDGAMMCAIAGVLALIDRQTAGFLSSTIYFVYPLPMMVFCAKYGNKGSWTVLFSMIVVTGIFSTIPTMLSSAGAYLIGMLYGSGVYKKKDGRLLRFRTMALGGLIELLVMVVFADFFGYDLVAEVAEMKEIFTSLGSAYDRFLADNTIKTMIIISAIMTGIMEGFVSSFLGNILMKRLRIALPPEKPLIYYYPPKWLGYAALGGMLLYYWSLTRTFSEEWMSNVCLGIGMFCAFYLLVYGMLAMSMTLQLQFPRMPRWGKVLILMLLLPMGFAISLVGFIYITTDLHTRLLEELSNHVSKSA